MPPENRNLNVSLLQVLLDFLKLSMVLAYLQVLEEHNENIKSNLKKRKWIHQLHIIWVKHKKIIGHRY